MEKRDESDDEGEEQKPQRKLTSVNVLEDYSNSHSETFDELLEWPYRRFLKAYGSHQKRKMIDELETKKNMHIFSLYSNSNLDDGKSTREDYVDSLEKFYETLKELVWKDSKETEKENREVKEMEDNNPFLKAGKRNRAKLAPAEIQFRVKD